MFRKCVLLLWLGVCLVLPSPPPASGQQKPVTDEQIQTAIKQAVAQLRQSARTMAGGGEGALVTMALLKSGQPADSPEIKFGINKIVETVTDDQYKAGQHHVYEAGVSLMALANADPKAYKPQIGAIAEYLIYMQRPTGEWDYPNPGNGDTSISQYAILGLWEAVRAGVAVPKRVWDKAAAWHVSRQLRDGSFTYHPPPVSPDGVSLGQPGTHTMTVAGAASLLVCRLHLYPGAHDPDEVRVGNRKGKGKKFGVLLPATVDDDEPEAVEVAVTNFRPTTRLAAIDKSIARAKDWLADNFTVAPKSPWDLYYLYGLERFSALAGIREIDGHDWYAEGAAHLVATQKGGTWSDQSGIQPATAFGVLFLGKATEKMLGRKAVRREPSFGGGLLIGGRGLPEDLTTVQVDLGAIRVRKLKGSVDELLAELENAQSRQIESAQAALVEKIATDDPEALIGQADRLLKLSKDKRVEVRRTVFWALGRSNELRAVPTLINGLNDSDPGCMVEARNALRFISKRIDVREPPDDATAEQRGAAIAFWKKWYLSVRPYDERDDLGEAPSK